MKKCKWVYLCEIRIYYFKKWFYLLNFILQNLLNMLIVHPEISRTESTKSNKIINLFFTVFDLSLVMYDIFWRNGDIHFCSNEFNSWIKLVNVIQNVKSQLCKFIFDYILNFINSTHVICIRVWLIKNTFACVSNVAPRRIIIIINISTTLCNLYFLIDNPHHGILQKKIIKLSKKKSNTVTLLTEVWDLIYQKSFFFFFNSRILHIWGSNTNDENEIFIRMKIIMKLLQVFLPFILFFIFIFWAHFFNFSCIKIKDVGIRNIITDYLLNYPPRKIQEFVLYDE